MENDFYGLQKQIWRMIKGQRKVKVNELFDTNQIQKETWVKYLQEVYGNEDESRNEPNIPEITTDEDLQKEVQAAIKQLKNRKIPGQDAITNELLKYGGESLAKQLTTLINKIVSHQKIPDNWRTSTTILMFKKRR
ncbi:uncharacterized protein LOC130894222 [Diorhabda carinulata]|uniref:uncharacterized protein LOC130894222 n=1 Tax=Diorhabda carinulata TaxID=1163345 RepID=UPI0025A18256|nr:uncharacterized protein LOC130894222 [Diorhabda carinulata]